MTSRAVWSAYVRSVVDHERQSEVGRRVGIDQATISRWLNGGKPGRPDQVADFARSYDHITSVREAFVAAGFLTQEEAGLET